MTYIEKFDYLKKTYGKKPDLSKLTEDFAAQITMTDEDCHGIFYVAYFNGVLAVEPYDYRDNTVAINVNSVLLEDILKGKADAVAAYNEGKLQAYGNLGHAMMMINALKKEPAKRKPAARKAAAPKAEKPAKKAAEKAEKAVKEVKEEVKAKAAPKAKKAAEKVEKTAEKAVEAVKEVKKETASKAKKTAAKEEKAVKEVKEEVKAAPKAKKTTKK